MSASPVPGILLLNGPNLNLLGSREPEIYGHETLEDVERLVQQSVSARGWALRAFQSNSEGALIDAVQAARFPELLPPASREAVPKAVSAAATGAQDVQIKAIIANLGAYSHTSIALRDALSSVALPLVEVHVTNIHQREEFRHHSYISEVAQTVIVGAGIDGYRLAAEHLLRELA